MNILYIRNFCLLTLVILMIASCSSKSQLVYLNDSVNDNFYKVDYSAFNNESDTLEQEIVKNMKPMITIPGPSDINVECGDENKK